MKNPKKKRADAGAVRQEESGDDDDDDDEGAVDDAALVVDDAALVVDDTALVVDYAAAHDDVQAGQPRAVRRRPHGHHLHRARRPRLRLQGRQVLEAARRSGPNRSLSPFLSILFFFLI